MAEGLHEAEHVIEGAVFKHQDDQMLDRCRHGGLPQINPAEAQADGTRYHESSDYSKYLTVIPVDLVRCDKPTYRYR